MNTATLAYVLNGRGLKPTGGDYPYPWRAYDLTDSLASGASLRIVVHPDDGDRIDVYGFDRRMVELWQVQLSDAMPRDIVIAALNSAVAWLAPVGKFAKFTAREFREAEDLLFAIAEAEARRAVRA
jgi:hypothetical protein